MINLLHIILKRKLRLVIDFSTVKFYKISKSYINEALEKYISSSVENFVRAHTYYLQSSIVEAFWAHNLL